MPLYLTWMSHGRHMMPNKWPLPLQRPSIECCKYLTVSIHRAQFDRHEVVRRPRPAHHQVASFDLG